MTDRQIVFGMRIVGDASQGNAAAQSFGRELQNVKQTADSASKSAEGFGKALVDVHGAMDRSGAAADILSKSADAASGAINSVAAGAQQGAAGLRVFESAADRAQAAASRASVSAYLLSSNAAAAARSSTSAYLLSESSNAAARALTGVSEGAQRSATALGIFESAADRAQSAASRASVSAYLLADNATAATKSSTSAYLLTERSDSAARALTGVAAGAQQSAAALRGFSGSADIAQGAADRASVSAYLLTQRASGSAAGMRDVGISAKQLSFALRGVPAQFTDIATSLASGQSPMLVMLQQGGQLKDMFGGIVPAARALAGYVAGLVGPFTVSAAAVGLLTVALAEGDAEQAAYRQALALTGSAAGVTADELAGMAREIASSAGTQAQAAAVLARLAESGRVDAQVMPEVAAAILSMARSGVADVDDLVKKFEDLAREPVKGIEKLNEAYNFLTPVVYDQIRALEEQGRQEEAVALAQRTASAALQERAKEVAASAGTMERAWYAVKSAVAKAWDAMLNVVRASPLAEQIAKARQEVERIRKLGDSGDGFNDNQLFAAEAQLRALEKQAAAERDRAAAGAETKRVMDSYLAVEKEIAAVQARGAPQTKTLAQALAEYRANLDKIRAANPNDSLLDPARIAAGEAALRKQYATHSTGARKAQQEAERLSSLMDKLGGLTSTYGRDLERLQGAYASGKLSLSQYVQLVEALILDQPFARDQAREIEKAQREQAKALEELTRATEAYFRPLEEAAARAELDLENYGLTEAQIQRVAVARLEEAQAIAAANGAMPEHLAFLEREIAARKRIAEAAAGKDARDAAKKAAEDSAKEWEKVADDIGRGLTDAIFQGGKDGWQLLKKTIEATVIRAVVQPVLTNAVGSLLGVSGAGGAAGGLLGNVVGSLLSNFGTSAIGGALLGSSAAYGAAIGTTSIGAGSQAALLAAQTADFGAAGLAATASAGGSALGGALSAISSAAPYIAAAALALNALGAFKGSTPHRGGAYVAGTDGSGYAATAANTPNFGLTWGAYRSDRSAGVDAATKALSEGIAKSLTEALGQFDQTGSYKVATRFASDNDDWSQGAFRVIDEAGNVLVDFSKKYTKDANKALEQFGQDTQRAIVATLREIDLGGPVNAIFDSVDPIKSSLEEIGAALQAAQAWVAQGKQLTAAISVAFDTPTERLTAAFEALGATVPENADAYEALVRAQDLNTVAGRDMATSLLGTYELWGQVQDATEAAGKAAADAAAKALSAWQDLKGQLTGFRADLTTGSYAALSPEAAYQAAQASFDSQAKLAALGNQEALAGLEAAGTQLLEASRAYNASNTAYFDDLKRVIGVVDKGILLTDRKIAGFASGGDHVGGLRIVGERGPELEATGPARYFNADQTRELLSGNGGSAEVVRELQTVVRVLADGLSRMDTRLARIEGAGSEQARQLRLANDRRA